MNEQEELHGLAVEVAHRILASEEVVPVQDSQTVEDLVELAKQVLLEARCWNDRRAA